MQYTLCFSVNTFSPITFLFDLLDDLDIGQTVYLLSVPHRIPFKMICNMATFDKNALDI